MKKYKTTDQYIESLPEEKQAVMIQLRQILRKALPDAEEAISYSMPAFKQKGIVVWFAAAKNHYAIYVYPRVMAIFKAELKGFSGTKSAIHFEYGKPMLTKLIARIAKESLRQNLEKSKKIK